MASKFRNIPTAVSLDNHLSHLDGQRLSIAGRKRSLIPVNKGSLAGRQHSVFASKYDSQLMTHYDSLCHALRTEIAH